MSAEILEENAWEGEVKIEITVSLGNNMLENELPIQKGLD